METVTEVVKNMAGGDGEVTIKRILGEKELNGTVTILRKQK